MKSNPSPPKKKKSSDCKNEKTEKLSKWFMKEVLSDEAEIAPVEEESLISPEDSTGMKTKREETNDGEREK